MFRRSLFVRWVPRYFKKPTRPPHRSQHGAATRGQPLRRRKETPPPMTRRTSTSRGVVGCDVKCGATEASRLHVGSDPAIKTLMRRARELLSNCQRLEDSKVRHRIRHEKPTAAPSSGEAVSAHPRQWTWDGISFCAKTEVFAVLKSVLSPAHEPSGCVPAARGDGEGSVENKEITSNKGQQRCPAGVSHRPHLSVIPDEAVGDAQGYLDRLRRSQMEQTSRLTGVGSGSSAGSPVVLSLQDILHILQLYELMECEDGTLLLQLMDQLRSVVLTWSEAVTFIPTPGSTLPLGAVVSRLLLVSSSLGLAEEQVLQKLIDTNNPFLSSCQVARCRVADVVRLLVALHRFGFHHEPCYMVAVKVLKSKVLRGPLIPATRRALRKGVVGTPLHDDNKVKCLLLHMTGILLSEVLEALSGMALSLHREKVIVEFLAATVVATVCMEEVAEEREKEKESLARPARREGADNSEPVLALQVHRAAKLCEQMELPQPALAHVLQRLVVRHRGLIVDGGEGDFDPQRTGFFDAVTADMVKVFRSG
ncbi:hypothetical protein TRVL_01457 [Trypanosoma vivax]|uniref:Uncharacterized protein n=1 Tax=Trypanosoma vivax (strain Y486) TaxID=1055687 RepID=G0U7K5_TRYVY|nr:hypothetical protein TRVL_01457 [Trypanosoma vivax]CCC51863.1 conserved hypothetical protein [Trypanosoma vivax Y486]